jgi:predicted RNA polymerase sigma factor
VLSVIYLIFTEGASASSGDDLLEQQDRGRWDHAAIRRGRAALARAEQAGRGLGAYGLQAAIAECHAVAPSVGATNWTAS